MSSSVFPFTLNQVLQRVARPYRLPQRIEAVHFRTGGDHATELAIVIEQARRARGIGEDPDLTLKDRFIRALASLIREAMRPDPGDPVFQAMVLRHASAVVREYASLAAHAVRDRRAVLSAVNSMAHPARLARTPAGRVRDGLAELHTHGNAHAWDRLETVARRVAGFVELSAHPPLADHVSRLLESGALARLQRLALLKTDERVLHYRSLWRTQGPRPGSVEAAAQGAASRRRGAVVEAAVAQALTVLVRRLNAAQAGRACYRVVTAMHVPAALSAGRNGAKSEWDAAVLKRADTDSAWDVCLLLEAKASPDAASTDFSRLLRGLKLLAQADSDEVYVFKAQEGEVRLRGASLRALATGPENLEGQVLYCCDATPEASPRLLGAASRMQLLSAPASLGFAATGLAPPADAKEMLAPVWDVLLDSPQWRAVLHQYPRLQQVRELMVHIDDLSAVIEG